ncbi:hypothetical protein VTP01DRAFT_8367 [Rhizomucor pusillus]|uniref:uncharacterized protein n=1 Tax=Rhizomucor pusillus TaxID=4840 RepID=UPI003742BCC7
MSSDIIPGAEPEDLFFELQTLLDTFCSDAQQKFCIEQHVASEQQLQRIKQTINLVRTVAPDLDLIRNPNSASIRHSLTLACVEMLDCYQAVCHQRRVRAMREGMAQQLTAEWQELSQSFESKAKEQSNLVSLFDNLNGLQKAWKKPRQVERIMTSILATSELRAGAYVVAVDRQNYSQLGLKRKAIGSRQIVFECSRVTRGEQMETIQGICERFAAIFAQNAHHNLSQIDLQVRLAQPFGLAKRLRQLQEQVYLPLDYSQHEAAAAAAASAAVIDIDNVLLQHDNLSSIILEGGGNNPADHHQQQPPPPPPPNAVPPFRFSGTVEPSLWYPQDEEGGIQSVPTPSFVPSPWEWPDLLKVRHPYYPVLFGLFKKKRRRRRVPVMVRLRGIFSAKPRQESDQQDGEDEPDITFASVSVPDLCRHFCRAGRRFYEDVTINARLKHSQDSQLLQEIGRDLVNTYSAIQLEASRAVVHRILSILHDLSMYEENMQSTSNDDPAAEPLHQARHSNNNNEEQHRKGEEEEEEEQEELRNVTG